MTALATLFDGQSGRCFYCGGKCWLRGRETKAAARARLGVTPGLARARITMEFRKATEEHLVRQVDGGKRGANLVMACAFCNSHRGDTPVLLHKETMAALARAGAHPCHGVNTLASKRRPWRAAVPASVEAGE